MRLTKISAMAFAALIAGAGVATADESAELSIEGKTIPTRAEAPAYLENIDEVISGWVYRSDETQTLQADDFDNPAFVFVDTGADLFAEADGSAGKSCKDCHENVEDFAGLTTTLPRVNEAGELETLTDLVNECRTERMGAEPWKYSGTQMTAVTALIGLQSRGMPVNVAVDGPAAPFWEKGKELYYTRVGQLDLACANCHEDNYGNMIRADRLSQGQINGFPTYRLKNAKLNSVHGRFKGCMTNVRATPYKEGSDEFEALELYVASRGNGLAIETPSVRN
ncbi:sulfur oxidation c-type cytochrome SoxA [Brevirhabdus pacifica]|uniref:SoxAX cytochrome complex subunit A n=1 Tax=Brevirhabdus pacifica TaxID=1267768 RepID=A0A1U7DHI6_9RHOB|nr:sulfur oxidation c-type cytochrome SoxA [Brevirhabdus pacifica]APX89421.1 sulfur oxidation c-type cytochrome SoxA [Brevirhabdus pacifica]OWU76557.1 cytochrome C [Loktanella sp. 22II-4b]PJJ85936.1 sulfur-oxidizing protein SoxA [Brevirhabdus pacifica]